jgi:KDO2-lipid IV(A) lauroyltransferase
MASALSHRARMAFLRARTAVRTGAGWTAVGLLRALRLADRKRSANMAGAFMRRMGPWLPEHRVGRANVAAAFPDKTDAEIEQILAGVWENLGRVAAEFAHLDKLVLHEPVDDKPPDVTFDDATIARYHAIRAGGPTLFFTAHLANWEIAAISAHKFGLNTHILFRPPNVAVIRDAILKIRANCMGVLVPSGFAAPSRLANAIERGTHVGMLADQHDWRGIDVTFFGRTCNVNTLLGRLARQYECPIRGVRVIREADGNTFRSELTEPLILPRDADGRIDVRGSMQAVTAVIEGWVREHPEQWLWLHRRWR